MTQEQLPFAAGSDTSKAAADSMKSDAARLRNKVLATIGAAPGGLICDEVETQTGMRHQTASARVRELAKAGLIRDSGRRRPTRSGRTATVWVKV